MASPLTVTTTTSAGITTTKGFGAQVGADATAEGDIMGVFAALLGAANQTAATTTASAETSVDLGLGNIVNLSFGAGFGSEEGGETEDPEAVAAVIDATLPIQFPVEAAQTLTELVDGLADLKVRLEAGEDIDPELLKRIDAALDNLATEFDIDLSALPGLDDLKAIVANILPEDTSVAAQLTTALAPLAETLLSGSSETEVSADVELSALVKSIGEKLGALLQSFNDGDIAPEKLAALGLDADAGVALDTDLEAAITKLLNPPPVTVDASASAQVLATPQLKLTEPVLTGKAGAEVAVVATPTDAATPTDTETPDAVLSVAASIDSESQTGSDAKTSDDGKPKDDKAAATVAVAATVAAKEAPSSDPQVVAQPTHVASRIDATVARPVVQPGYQTSQQQLNLPQIAFELVRQVNDGNTRFQMRLDPPELGKIDVKLDIDSTGQVNARLTVERAETLDLMQRDQRGLERALQQAGLDSAKTNLEFSLKQSPFSGGNQQGQDGQGGRQPQFGGNTTADAEDTPPPMVNLYRGSLTATGVNIIA